MYNKMLVDISIYTYTGPNEDHFSNMVLMRTKSSIEDLFATTVCNILTTKVLQSTYFGMKINFGVNF